jgi:Concanavalin A-like lectin/glucanases superfamily
MSAYRDAVFVKGPVAYWRLGEAPGTGLPAHDETGNGHDGMYNGPLTLGEPGAIIGDADTAVGFAKNGFVQIPNDPAFSQPTSTKGLSVEVWMRPDVIDFPVDDPLHPYVHWLAKGAPGQQEWALRLYTSRTGTIDRPNRVSAYLFNPDGTNHEGAGAFFQKGLGAGEWLHVVACYQPGDKTTCPPAGPQIYRNGQLADGPPSIGTLYCNACFPILPAAGSSPVFIGRRDNSDFFPGALDEVAIYPRVLTAVEVLENYRASGRK